MQSINLETSPVPGQSHCAVLDLHGNRVHGDLSKHDATILYQMLVEVGSLALQKFRRMTVTFSSSRYILSRDENYVYIVKVRIP
jgi:hypothetical protein